eukprot:768448-Hanusia_phi.AAC.18
MEGKKEKKDGNPMGGGRREDGEGGRGGRGGRRRRGGWRRGQEEGLRGLEEVKSAQSNPLAKGITKSWSDGGLGNRGE